MGAYLLTWGSLSLVLLSVLQSSMMYMSSGCFTEERAALMDIKSSLTRANSMVVLDSWGQGDDCCVWELVVCENSTRRISHLHLSGIYYPPISTPSDRWHLNLSVFSAFHELQFLDLSWNYPSSLSFDGLVGLKKLQYLDFTYCSLEGSFPVFNGEFGALEVLVLNHNHLNRGLSAQAFQNLQNLRQLNLSLNHFGGELSTWLFELPHLKILDLSNNLFEGSIPTSSSLKPFALEILDLSHNHLSGELPTAVLKNIRSLNLRGNQFQGSLPVSLFALPQLKFLDLSQNSFDGHIPTRTSSEPLLLEVLNLQNNRMSGSLCLWSERAFGDLQNLRELYLSSNQFSGSLPTFLFSLPHIELLDLSANLLEGPIPISISSNLSLSLKNIRFSQNNLSGTFPFIWLRNLTKLEEIDFSGNPNLAVDINFPGWIPPFQLKRLVLSSCELDKSTLSEPYFLHTQHHLKVLDLSDNNLTGNMPNWLFRKETALVSLNLGNNLLTGSFAPVCRTCEFFQYLNLSMNRIEGQLPSNISSMFPILSILDFSNNNFSGQIPTSFCQIGSMDYLDLSDNRISGKLPACMFTNYMLVTLKVSNNELSGLIFDGVNNLSIISQLYLDNNKFEGTIPHNLSGQLKIIDLHGNRLSGKLDASFWNLSSLRALNLADNHITGEIHPQICKLTGIVFLDLSNNNLTGSIPDFSCTSELRFLNLSRNYLSGNLSESYFNTSNLIALDITYNQFTGNLNWVGYLGNTRLLSLAGNNFEGQITPNLCKLQYLRIIDFSHNKLSGSLPACIGGLSLIGRANDQTLQPVFETISDFYDTRYSLRGFNFATKGHLYTYGGNFFISMSGIDLSANMLDGEIPWQLGNLSHIRSLNLSYNFFTGQIPATFASMNEIESLDLSHNNLSGPIPWQLTQLASLGAFSVAYNNLSGCIPNYGQLSSFSIDSYLGNNNLHKISQGKRCSPSPGAVAKEDVGERYDDPVLYIVSAASLVMAFWATVAFSFCHSYRQSVKNKM
ncbi:receptor-like protein 1 [Oryza glaberrima]|uniref:receptor-like protein 1 n=1 Tax=Oryza glaberrima TaxID=4538 RepID=UPI00224C4331|nr:receptor-like protein 1 [Oryza glaberrima]